MARRFLDETAFVAKGRFSGLLAEVPVHVVLEPKTALRGAASRALKHVGS